MGAITPGAASHKDKETTWGVLREGTAVITVDLVLIPSVWEAAAGRFSIWEAACSLPSSSELILLSLGVSWALGSQAVLWPGRAGAQTAWVVAGLALRVTWGRVCE